MVKFTRGNGLLEVFLAKKRANKANSFISDKLRNGRILDIGCGSYPYFLINTNFNEKFGLDPSLMYLEIENKKINLQKLDITKNKLPFKKNYFDVVTMLAVFEHLDNSKLVKILTEIKDVLKPNGVFIITTPSPWSDKILHRMATVGLISSEEIHEHKTHHSKKIIEHLIINSGFKKSKLTSGYFEFGFNMFFVVKK